MLFGRGRNSGDVPDARGPGESGDGGTPGAGGAAAGEGRPMKRKPVSSDLIWAAASDVKEHMEKVIMAKGDGAFSSPHEILGAITEEYHELVRAVRHDKPGNPASEEIQHELKDLAVLAIFGLACFKVKEVD